MTRLRRSPDQPAPRRAITAAAATITQAQLRSLNRSYSVESSWQEQAWHHYDVCGEFRFAANWIANVMSRIRLYPAFIADSEDEPEAIEEGPAADIMAELHGGPGGQSQMLRRLGVHMSVPGESFVVTWQDAAGAPKKWATLCGDEIGEKAGSVVIKVGGEDVVLPSEHTIIRIWRPHPRFHWDADSPGRGMLPVLRELENLSERVTAQIESRLAGSGVLFLPESITFPVQEEDGSVRVSSDPGEFMKILANAMITPIKERDHASAVVPIMAQAAPDAIEAIRHLTFATELDDKTQELREGALRRLALGVDMPPEILLGLGGTSHWNSWEISENAITQHVEPLANVMTEGLAANWLRPALAAKGIPDVDRYVIGADTAELVNRPNRGPDAIQLYDRKELSGNALRREHGFSDADAYTATEARQRELREMLSHAGIDAATTNKLLELLGYVQPGVIPQAPPGTSAGPAVPGGPPAPAPAERSMPPRPEAAGITAGQAMLALQAVGQYAAVSALEFAGKRLLGSDRALRHRFDGVPNHEIHTRVPVTNAGQYRSGVMLDGAFNSFDMLPEMGPLRDVVERHVEWLLLEGLPLDRGQLDADIRAAFAESLAVRP